ncbi:hypothetical protein JI739_23045 [Ramlibacter sp. AW1]|uniref:Ketosynthase family 3 (KS3) domain-containing protein n=1 Tax=Ramlibacter aurantiacus TaxID=2801330 RepID=A0A937D7E1_9BURK|nr:beta-ketoacyl synthase N-terminal-like domain-containing protein [Ramlibacter aurantiacus]MBL0423232.1 hypothetical protein [Ramlibacter aurantiacus]
MPQPPIAIVGRGCVLPGADSPAALSQHVRAGSDLLSRPPQGAWPMDPALITLDANGIRWSDRGGYVDGFEFDPTGFAVDPEVLLQADRCAHWVLHASRQALREAGHDCARGHPRTGAILGHLCLPLPSLVRDATSTWMRRWAEQQGLAELLGELNADPVVPENRYMAALPTRLLVRALGLGAEAFTLDAACASSLYALKLACDALAHGRADLMLAGAACGTDAMFLHIGFRALKALSPTGQSRPFHREANGLVPSHGAVILALKRLADAEAAGDRILGVVRAIGLSNDGGAGGLLVPSSEGQVRCMRQALDRAAMSPADVGLLECHATGTPVGDAVELASIRTVYGEVGTMPIGSIKSQIGHPLAVSGAAGILKILGGFEAGMLPASAPVDDPLPGLAEAPVRLVTREEPWAADRPWVAAVSSFGFGGNNAHVILQAYQGRQSHPVAIAPAPGIPSPLAIIGVGVIAAAAADTACFARSLVGGHSALTDDAQLGRCGVAAPFDLKPSEIRFPPRDLADSLPQQVVLLRAASEALATVRKLPNERTGVLTGMECDAEIARQLARELVPARLRDWSIANGPDLSDEWLQQARNAFAAPLKASVVTGSLPNIVPNRLNAQFKLAGFGYSVFADELSGLRALDIAARALRDGELDAAIVTAVDLCCEPVSAATTKALSGPGRAVPGDAVVALVLKRLDDARRDGETVFAVLEAEPPSGPSTALSQPLLLGDAPGALQLAHRYGHAHAASGLLHVAAAAIACQHRARLTSQATVPWLPGTRRTACVDVRSQDGQQAIVHMSAEPAGALPASPSDAAPRIWAVAAADRQALAAALSAESWAGEGPARLAFVASAGADFERQHRACLDFLRGPAAAVVPPGMAFHATPLAGDVAAVYTAAGAAYRGMGRELLLACPDLVEHAATRLGNVQAGCDWMYDGSGHEPTPLEQLAGCSLLSQVHAELSTQVLKLQPQAAIGLSSGETNAIVGLGAWSGVEGLFDGLAPLYANGLGGRFELLRQAWQDPQAQWAAWAIALPPERVREALRDERHAYLTMIYGPSACAIGGESKALDRVVARLGGSHATRVAHDVAVHCPELLQVRDTWRALHHRSTRELADVRFYTAAACHTYRAEADRIADALLEMASGPVDFHAMVERAWQDGVRVFVEHGPRDLCTRWITDILRGREHLAVALDADARQPVRNALAAAAHLWAAGVPVDLKAFNDRLGGAAAKAAPSTGGVRFASHMPPIELPAWPPGHTAPGAATAEPRSPRSATLLHPESDMNALVRTAVETTPPPLWSRSDLEEMSHGRLSKFFGPRFEVQDGYERQVRMPMPPLLMADRVMEIEGEPGSMGLGRIVTETDITLDSWYLHEGSMPAGLEVEAGQADLLLISYLGADLFNKGERVYRLLGCEMTFNGEQRPRIGDTLRYEIKVTGHARTGDVRLFFFQYDSYLNGELRLSVRNGRAGFFTENELENAGGVIWDPATDGPDPSQQHVAMPPVNPARSFSREQVRAFAEGRPYECFGRGFETTASHHRTPRIQGGDMQLFQDVEELDPHGGPWGRGYLRGTYAIRGDEWFFPGHFKNDPTMPGTLMCEAGVQLMAFYFAALGYTRERDGWTFEMVPGATFKAVCRGQVVPSARHMSYEILVRAIEGGDIPTLWADVLLTVDGRKAFHGRNLGLRLWPGFPLKRTVASVLPAGARPPAVVDGFTFDHASLLHCATGQPSLAFGPRFTDFDSTRTLPRLPAPPYHFMSRITRCEGQMAAMLVGTTVEVEYDIPTQAWYYDDGDGSTMPYAVLMEAALQPCGWLTAYMGVPLQCETDLRFRNLDGDGTLMRPVRRGDGILRTTARCTSIARNGNTFIESFDVECRVGDAVVYVLKTTFGHFTQESLAQQVGIPATAQERHAIENVEPRQQIDLHQAGDAPTLPRLAHGQLLMLDRVTGYSPKGGASGRGRLVAEFDVNPAAWFFKAHFYRDPVQPGSLGVEAMIQLLQFHMRDRGLAAGMRLPVFEPVAVGQRLLWKYRGQVLPTNRKVTVELEVSEEGRDEAGPWLRANAWLWVDGTRIYQAKGLTMRIVEGATS